MTFSILANRYVAAGCPDKRGVRRPSTSEESRRLENLRPHFSRVLLVKLSIRHCAEYGAANAHRQRAADLDLQTLANLCWFGVAEGVWTTNPVLGRARTRRSKDVVHCREAMPRDGDELHRIARELLSSRQSEATGWQLLFEAFTGCRTSEVLALRVDAAQKAEPGYVEGEYLYVRRSKSGGFPYVRINSDLRSLMAAHRAWLGDHSPWYFPGPSRALPLARTTLTHRLEAICPRLGIGRVTSHGLRAYFVTVARSRGLSNQQVAALIGDRTASLIESTYGSLPEVWSGGAPLSLMPSSGLPAWASDGDAISVDFRKEA